MEPAGGHDDAVIRVLAVIEDHPDMRVLLQHLLCRERGFEVLAEAASAAEALEVLPAGDGAGVIVLDQNLEGPMTGLEVAPLLKQQAPGARIVLFTAHDLRAEAAACPAIDGFVRKDRLTDLPGVLRALTVEEPSAAGH